MRGALALAMEVGPVGAEGAGCAGWVVDAFFVGAAEDPFGRDHLANAEGGDEGGDFGGGGRVIPNVAVGDAPGAEGDGFAGSGGGEDSDHEFGGAGVVGTVSGEGGPGSWVGGGGVMGAGGGGRNGGRGC